MINSSRRYSQQQTSNFIVEVLLRNYRIIFLWGGLLVTTLVIAMMGYAGLVNPGVESADYVATPPKIAPTTLEQPQPQPKSESQQAGFPLWMIASLVMGCASGSLMVTYVLKYVSGSNSQSKIRVSSPPKVKSSSKKPQTVAKPPEAKPQVKPQAKKKPKAEKPKIEKQIVQKAKPKARKQPKRPVNPVSQPQTQPLPPQYPYPRNPIPERIAASINLPMAEQTIVTVVSPEESVPLDRRGEPTLADLMDLRKRRSLASLIQNQ